jgi:hypothetical protein
MNQQQQDQLESAAVELIDVFGVLAPPLPIETMLQNPVDGLWEKMDLSQLSGSFLVVKDQFSPRMSLARLLARHVVNSQWGQSRQLPQIIGNDENNLRIFARMLIMPHHMIDSLTSSSRNATAISREFEVPEEDAHLRLTELIG